MSSSERPTDIHKEDGHNAISTSSSNGKLGAAGAQWTLWQICDSGLPTGSFAHSAGLEAAAAQGIVRAKHAASLMRFVRGVLANASSLQLPLLRAAFRVNTLEGWLEVDSVAHACVTGEAARRASLAQGAGLLRATQAMFPLSRGWGEIINEFRAFVRRGAVQTGGAGNTKPDEYGTRIARGHQAPAFGIVCAAIGVDEDDAARAFMFLVARDVLSAATRLSLIGPLEAGRIVSSLSGYVESLVATGGSRSSRGLISQTETSPQSEASVMGRVCQVDPMQDIVQGLHDRLYSRMFNS